MRDPIVHLTAEVNRKSGEACLGDKLRRRWRTGFALYRKTLLKKKQFFQIFGIVLGVARHTEKLITAFDFFLFV